MLNSFERIKGGLKVNKRAFILGLITVTIWGSGFAGIRASLNGGFTAGHLMVYRYLIASFAFFLYAIFPKSNFKLPKKEDLLSIFILSVVGITFYHLGVTFGQLTISAGTTGMIVGTAPIFTTLIAVFILKEKMAGFGWVGLGIGFIGVTLITLGTSDGTFTFSGGLFLVFFATISTSFFFVYQKPLLTKYHPIDLVAYLTWAGTIPMLVFLPGLFDTLRHATVEANLSAIYVGIFPAAVCYATWAMALSLGNVSTISSMLYLEPPIAIFVAWIWLNELPSTLSMIGGFIAISSVALVNFVGRRKQKVPST